MIGVHHGGVVGLRRDGGRKWQIETLGKAGDDQEKDDIGRFRKFIGWFFILDNIVQHGLLAVPPTARGGTRA